MRRKRHIVRQLSLKHAIGIAAVVLIAGVGIYFLASTHAASPYASVNADAGTTAGGAVVESCAGAADGKCVVFGTKPPTALTLMPLGDSITDGYVVPGGYRTLLWQDLTQTDKDDINFVGSNGKVSGDPASLGDLNVAGNNGYNHEGNSGWCIGGGSCCCGGFMVANIAGWLKTYQPQLILLHAGTNDIATGDTGAQVTSSMNTLLSTIFQTLPKVHVIVAQVIPIIDVQPLSDFTSESAALNSYDASIPGLVSNYTNAGDNIQIVDMQNILNPATDYYTGDDEGDLTDQDYHPNQAGYNVIAQTWEPLVTAQYQSFEANPW